MNWPDSASFAKTIGLNCSTAAPGYNDPEAEMTDPTNYTIRVSHRAKNGPQGVGPESRSRHPAPEKGLD
jgi:hypothetical protein